VKVQDGLSALPDAASADPALAIDDEIESMRKSRGFDCTPLTKESARANSPFTEIETGITEKFSAVMLLSVAVVGAAGADGVALALAVGVGVGVAVAVALAPSVAVPVLGVVATGGAYAAASPSVIVATFTPVAFAVALS